MEDIPQHEALVDRAILKVVLPKCYEAMDDLIDLIGHDKIPKAKLIEYRRLLPGKYRNSFERPKT